MAHLHDVRDTDKHFVIDPITMGISTESPKLKLMQGDHNSEIYTFEIPKTIESHDMSLCNRVEIHYNDISTDKANSSKDFYTVKDMEAAEDNPEMLVFSWLVSGNATKYDGLLSFRIRFGCVDENGVWTYKKHTDIYSGITISKGFDNTEAVINEYADAISAWEAELDALEAKVDSGGASDEQIAQAVADYLDKNPVECGIKPVAKTADMTQPVGIDENGRLWVAPIGGGSGGTDEPDDPDTPDDPDAPVVITHGVIWDLVNVTSSNTTVSVNDGESLSAVLIPADGYTLGDVTVTMSGEVLTDVWNADTETISIASVTGDVVISCAGVEESTGETADTSPVIAKENTGIADGNSYQTSDVLCVTKQYEYSWDVDALKATQHYDATNDYMKSAGRQGGIKLFIASENYVAGGGTASATGTGWGQWVRANLFADGVYVVNKNMFGSLRDGTEIGWEINNNNSTILNAQKLGFEFPMCTADVEGSYAYWYKPYADAILPIGVSAGDIIFAGKDSPYYGMKNIDGTMLSEASVADLTMDDDYAQDYGVATTSVLGDDPATGADVYAGVSDEFAAVINSAKKEWMTEYGGDYRKIPLIVSTDQHGRTSGIFNLLGRILNMHDVSKICNLGDTVTDKWVDADTANPLLSCAELEAWTKSMKAIPFSKQLNVFGNHDAWHSTADGNPYPSNLSHLDQYFRNIYARRTNNNGWFAIKDDYFNVKYLVLTGLEWADGSAAYRISTAQMEWIISELSANDGYDVVIVSHVPLKWDDEAMTQPTGDANESGGGRLSVLDTDAFFAARKIKGSGTITDSEGVSHNYDFSGCTTDVLCSLHGHLHCDAYMHLNDELLVNCFDWFPYETFFMVLIDRVNRQLNIWKIDNTPQYVNYQIPLDKPTT